MHAVCLTPAQEPAYMILEYMAIGDLEEFLKSPMARESLTRVVLVRFLIDISAGMNYLGNENQLCYYTVP